MENKPYELNLEIGGLPKMINETNYSHWAVKVKDKNKWQRIIFLLTRGKTPKEPLERAYVKFTRYSSREPDYDGLVGSFKACCDALVHSGIIVDDSSKHLQREYQWVKIKQNAGKITIQLAEQT